MLKRRVAPALDRIADSSIPTDTGCRVWIRSVGPGGYAEINVGGRWLKAHRLVYEAARGPIPAGLVIDHLCRNRACVNPDHMEVVSNRENILRGVGPSALHARATHCKNGHPWDGENTKLHPGGWRQCRACWRANSRAYLRRWQAHS